jgi:hypothetical protein
MSHLWFRTKRYGWGWTPASVEGWLVLAVFYVGVVIDIAVFVHRLHAEIDHRSALSGFLVGIGILAAALIGVCFVTGERPRWRWGD